MTSPTLIPPNLITTTPLNSGLGSNLPTGGQIIDAFILQAWNKTYYTGIIDIRDYASTIDLTGNTDSAAGLNQARSDAIINKRKLVAPGNAVVLIGSPWYWFNATLQDSFCFEVLGTGGAPTVNAAKPTFPLSTYINNFVIYSPSLTLPAIILNCNRFTSGSGFALLGLNPANGISQIPNRSASAYVGSGCRDSQYSPHCGIVIDAFNGPVPPDGGYPGLTSMYNQGVNNGSYGLLFSHISVQGFVVNIGYGICTQSVALAADITFDHVSVAQSKVNYAFGCSQSDNVNIDYGNCTDAFTAYDGINYGLGQGKPPLIRHPNIGFAYRWFAIQSAYGPLTIEVPYAESCCSLGLYGANALAEGQLLIIGGEGSYYDAPGWPIPPIQLETYGPTMVKSFSYGAGYSFNMDAMNIFNGSSTPTIWEGGTLTGPATAYLMPHVGRSIDGSGSYLIAENSLINGHNGGSKIPWSRDRPRTYAATSYTQNLLAGRFITDMQGRFLYNGNELLEYERSQSSEIVGYRNVSAIAFATGGTNLTFTCTTPADVFVGDILCWQFLAMPNSGLQWRGPGFKVSSVVGNAITALPLFDSNLYDTATNWVATFGAGAIYVYPQEFAPLATATCTTNGTANISAMTNTGFVPGDFVFSSGNFPAWARIVSINRGAGTAVLNYGASSSTTGCVITSGVINKPTVTAWNFS